MAQIPDIKSNLQVNTDSWNSVADAIDYAGGDSDDYVTTYGDKIKKIVDDKDTRIEELDTLNKDLSNENNELENTVTEYESNFLDINNAILNKGVNPAGGYDTYAEAISEIGGEEVTVNLQSKEVEPTVNGVTVTPDADYNGLSSVVVKPVDLEEIHETPALVEKEIVPSEGKIGISKVIMGAVDASIDENIKPENIKKGVKILGVDGTHECESKEPVLVELNITPSNEVQVFTPAEGEDGYSKVTVDAVPESGGGEADPVLSPLEVTPSTEEQVIETPDGVDGFNPVTVKKVDNTIDSNIQADNIRDGINILGVVGTFKGTGDAKEITNANYICYQNCRSIDDYVGLIKNCTSFNYAFYQCNLTADSYSFDLSQATSWNYWLDNARSMNKDKETTLNIIVGTKIDNLLTGLNYNGNANRIIHIKLSKPADVKLTSASNVFNGSNYIASIDFGNIFDNLESINCSNFFDNFNGNYSNKLEVDLTSLDFSKITNCNRMFNRSNLNKLILGDVELYGINCQNMFSIFAGVLEYNDTLKFENCSLDYAFEGCSVPDLKIDIIQDNNTNAGSSHIFRSSKIENITSNNNWEFYRNIDSICYDSTNLKTIPIINKYITASNKDNIGNAFYGCASLEEVTLNIIYNNPDTYWRLYCDSTFNGCTSLKKIIRLDLSGQYAQYNNIFKNCVSLEEIIGKGTLAGYNTTASMTWDLSASPVFRPLSWLQSLDAIEGKTRIIKLHANVYNSLSEEVIALATEKNITLASA